MHLLLFNILLRVTLPISLPIRNAGFETDTLPNGDPIPIQTYIYGSSLITDWILYDPNSIATPHCVGIANPTNSGQYILNKSYEGNQNAWLWTDETGNLQIGIIQQLPYTITSDTIYTLSVWIGNPSSSSWSDQSTDGATNADDHGFPGYRIDLLANNNNILVTDDNTLSLSEGDWKQSVISINITSSNPYIGQQLSIRLVNLNLADGREIAFDAVELDAIHIFKANAIYSNDFLFIYIDIEMEDIISLGNNCSDIFDNNTVNNIGGNNANCQWITNLNNTFDIRIELASSVMINSILIIKSEAFLYSLHGFDNIKSVPIQVAVDVPLNISNPDIIIDTPIEIGSCDDLILDARNTKNLGLRNGIFEWNIYAVNTKYTSALVIIPNVNISKILNKTILIGLTVKSWFGGVSHVNITVNKSLTEEEMIPIINLHGINEYALNNNQMNNDKIDIYSSIIFTNDCNNYNKDNMFNVNEYHIQWFVNIIKQNANEHINQTRVNLLQNYLISKTDYDSISIDVSTHIQPGFKYIFIMNFKCDENSMYNCNINTTHSIDITYPNIMCKIMGGNILLNHISFKDLSTYKRILNGDLFTLDPMYSSKNHLGFDWKCINDININNSCDQLFSAIDKSIITVDFSTISLDTTDLEYSYTFLLEVFDETNMNRDSCNDYIQFNAHINNTNTSIIRLFISATAISNTINVYDKVRIITDIINDIDTVYEHHWFETNGLLTGQQMIEYSESAVDSLNLILKSNILTAGITYSFQLEVFKYDNNNNLIIYGKSAAVKISVLIGPTIIENSFMISPPCVNGIITYDTINEYMKSTQSLSVTATGDTLPLLYQFVYDNNKYFHPNLLSTPYIDNIKLPIGNNIVSVHVFDGQNTLATSSIQCSVVVHSNTECIDKHNMYDDIDSLITEYDKYLYILHTSNIYLLYLIEYKDSIYSIEECLDDILSIILDTLYYNIYGNYICENNINFVVLLSQVMKLWMDLIDSDIKLTNQFYNNKANKLIIETLLFTTLDPCKYIKIEIGYEHVEKLTVSIDSILTNTAKIYYKNTDITSYLSIIETNDNYKHLLYSLSSSIIEFIKYTNNQEIYNLLSASLYIASLSSISTSIPGEEITIKTSEFSLFSKRISNNNNISMTLQNISVYIPGDIFTKNTKKSIQNPLDILLIGINTNESSVNISNINDDKCAHEDGILSKESISVTIIGNNTNSSQLSSNIEFDFNCNASIGCDNNTECVYYNPINNKWQNDGCITIINNIENKIRCQCNHLTTFSIVHNINFDECDTFINEIINNSKSWNISHSIFMFLFFIILVYSIREIIPFIIHKKYYPIKDKCLLSMTAIAMISFINIIICISFIGIGIGKWYKMNTLILTFLLYLPIWLYFIVFSIVLFSWILVATSFVGNEFPIALLSKSLFISNIILIFVGFIDFLIVSIINISSNMLWIYSLSQFLWIVLLFIASIIFTIYGYKTQKIIRLTAENIRNLQTIERSSMDKEIALANKLLFATIIISLFFLIQCILLIYFVASNNFNNESILEWRIIDLLSNVICLCVICSLYRNAFERLRIEYEIKPLCDKQNKYIIQLFQKCKGINTPTLDRVRNSSYSTRNTNTNINTNTNTNSHAAIRKPSQDLKINIDNNNNNSIQLSTINEIECKKKSKSKSSNEKTDSKSLSLIKNDHSPPVDVMDTEIDLTMDTKNNKKIKRDKNEGIMERKELLKLNKTQLAKKCRQWNVPSNGNKGELVKRLINAQKQKQKQKKKKSNLKLEKVVSHSQSVQNNEGNQQNKYAE